MPTSFFTLFQSNTVDIPVTVKDAIRKFRFRSNKVSQDVALVIKIDKTKLEMKVEEELEGTVEEIAEELPENGPRFIVLSHPLVSVRAERVLSQRPVFGKRARETSHPSLRAIVEECVRVYDLGYSMKRSTARSNSSLTNSFSFSFLLMNFTNNPFSDA